MEPVHALSVLQEPEVPLKGRGNYAQQTRPRSDDNIRLVNAGAELASYYQYAVSVRKLLRSGLAKKSDYDLQLERIVGIQSKHPVTKNRESADQLAIEVINAGECPFDWAEFDLVKQDIAKLPVPITHGA